MSALRLAGVVESSDGMNTRHGSFGFTWFLEWNYYTFTNRVDVCVSNESLSIDSIGKHFVDTGIRVLGQIVLKLVRSRSLEATL